MEDKKGIFYYPLLQDRTLKMYVRLSEKDVEFRPDKHDDPELWEEHGWVPYSAILKAKRLNKEGKMKANFPFHLYDIDIAIRLLKDAIHDKEDWG